MGVYICALMLAALSAGAQQREPDGARLFNEKVARLGATLAEDVRKNSTIIANPLLLGYVERLGRQLAAQLPDTGLVYTFEIIHGAAASSTYEPMSLPGGFVFVPHTLFLAAANEAEFAGMLAHAMAHAAERHGLRQASRDDLIKHASIPLIYMGGWGGFGANPAAVPRQFLTSMRGYEMQADLLAVRTISLAGYDPAALAAYIGRTQVDPAVRLREDSPLPPREERLAAIREAVAALPARTYLRGDDLPGMQEEARRVVPEPPRRAPTLRR